MHIILNNFKDRYSGITVLITKSFFNGKIKGQIFKFEENFCSSFLKNCIKKYT